MMAIFPLLFPATFLGLLVLERFLPNRPQPHVRGWLVKALVFFAIAGAINGIVPKVLGATLARYEVLDLSGLGIAGGALVSFLAATFVVYWLHRTFHRVAPLWRWTHQMHHSAERVDVAGFAYGHPFELIIVVTFPQIVALVLGVRPEAAMLAGYAGFAHNLFTHINTYTPHWLGYFVQRPEMHLIHHERGVHAYNYGLPLWDLVFGTHRNPVKLPAFEVGFWDGASARVGAMLVGRDVSSPSLPVR